MAIVSGDRNRKVRRTPEALAFRGMSGRTRARKQPGAGSPHLVARGKRIEEIRIARGFPSQLVFADDTKSVDSGSLSEIERGEKDVTLTKAERIADGLRVSLDVISGRVPFDPLADIYPARSHVVASPEFQAAPIEVRQRFMTAPDGAETWSTVRWASVFLGLLDSWNRFGSLPALVTDNVTKLKPR